MSISRTLLGLLEEVEWPAEVAVGYLCDFYRAEVEHHDGDFLGVDISGSHAIRELMRPLVHQAVTSRLVEGSIPSRLTIQSGGGDAPRFVYPGERLRAIAAPGSET